MFKRILTLALTLMLLFALAACGDSGNDGDTGNPSGSLVLDLSGGWKQTNSNSETDYQIAMIADDVIEIYWVFEEDDLTALYWAGTYVSPTTDTNEYSWNSINDKATTDMVLLASTADDKTFTYKNGVISYSVSAMGETMTVEISRSDEVDINIQKSISPDEFLPLELADSGYSLKKGSDYFYIQYAFAVENPNTEIAVRFPTVRLTARDENGIILGTRDVIGMQILPGEAWVSAFQGPRVDSIPASVDFEIVQPDSSDWVPPDLLDYSGEPLDIENLAKRGDKIVGEVVNPNNYDIDTVAVVIVFFDDDEKLLAGDTTFVNKLSANGKIPFELSLRTSDDYITENAIVFAYPWM